MIDPITAFAAVQSAVKLIKKASETADDVASLGPLIGKYFDAKHTAAKAVQESKKAGGSNMGKAIEIELALKSQRDFEEQLKGLFFSSNNMDIWNNIMKRVQEMNAADAEQTKKDNIAAAKRKRQQEEMTEIAVAVGILIVAMIFIGWALVEFLDYCKAGRCSR